MGRLIERYLKEMKGTQDIINGKEEASQDDILSSALDNYEGAADNGDLVKLPAGTFDVADEGGNLIGKDSDGVRIYVTAEDMTSAISYYGADIKDRFIDKEFVATIVKVDRENSTVYVKPVAHERGTTKSQLVGELKSELAKGNNPHIMGTVTAITTKALVVNILGKDVRGVCPVDYWSVNYTRFLKQHVRVGDVVDFDVIEVMPKLKGKETAFSLDHRPYTKDAWENFPKDITVGAILTVQCIERPEGKSYWWGVSDAIDGLEIQCDYNRNLRIMVSLKYKCKVDKLDIENKQLRVVPFELTQINEKQAGAVEFISQTKSRGKKR